MAFLWSVRKFFRRIRHHIIFTLGLTRREQIGLLVIYPVAILLLFLSTWYDNSALPENASAALEYEFTRLEVPPGQEAEVKADPLLPFMADTISEAVLTKFGIPDRVARSWVRYREAAGHISTPAQLRKLYGMNDSILESIRPFLVWPDAAKSGRQRKPGEELDMNLADTVLWQSFRGIGPVLSARIVAFREALGGFVSREQLREVYGIDSLVCQQILPQVYVASGFVPRQLNLSEASYAELRAHPYISSRQASAIVMYRSQHGQIDTAERLLSIHQLDTAFLEKTGPYLVLKEMENG